MPLPVHGLPMPAMSSDAPLQSSSTPLHDSPVFATPPVHVRAPAVHLYRPVTQRVPPPEFMQSDSVPVGQHAVFTHASVRLSSPVPLQSSSRPLHVSTDGPTFPLHTSPPFVHATTPALHWPLQFATSPPGHKFPHATPTPAGLSSTTPLQRATTPPALKSPSPPPPPGRLLAPPAVAVSFAPFPRPRRRPVFLRPRPPRRSRPRHAGARVRRGARALRVHVAAGAGE